MISCPIYGGYRSEAKREMKQENKEFEVITYTLSSEAKILKINSVVLNGEIIPPWFYEIDKTRRKIVFLTEEQRVQKIL